MGVRTSGKGAALYTLEANVPRGDPGPSRQRGPSGKTGLFDFNLLAEGGHVDLNLPLPLSQRPLPELVLHLVQLSTQ